MHLRPSTWGREAASFITSLKGALGVERLVELQSVSGPPLHRARTAAITGTGHLAATIRERVPRAEYHINEHSDLFVLRLPFTAEPGNFEEKGKRRKWGKCEALSSAIRDSVKCLSKHLASRCALQKLNYIPLLEAWVFPKASCFLSASA